MEFFFFSGNNLAMECAPIKVKSLTNDSFSSTVTLSGGFLADP